MSAKTILIEDVTRKLSPLYAVLIAISKNQYQAGMLVNSTILQDQIELYQRVRNLQKNVDASPWMTEAYQDDIDQAMKNVQALWNQFSDLQWSWAIGQAEAMQKELQTASKPVARQLGTNHELRDRTAGIGRNLQQALTAKRSMGQYHGPNGTISPRDLTALIVKVHDELPEIVKQLEALAS